MTTQAVAQPAEKVTPLKFGSKDQAMAALRDCGPGKKWQEGDMPAIVAAIEQFAVQGAGKGGSFRVTKTVCPISRTYFQVHGADLENEVQIGGIAVPATPKQFSSGGFGWNLNGKATLLVGGKRVPCQVSGNIIVINSKEAPDTDPTDREPAGAGLTQGDEA